MCFIEVYVIRSQSSVPNSQTSEVARTHSMRRSLKLSSSASKSFRLSRLRWNKAKHFEHSDEILENESKKSLEVFVGVSRFAHTGLPVLKNMDHPHSYQDITYTVTLNRQSRPVCTSSSVVVSCREHTWEFPKWLTIHAHLGCLTDWPSHWKIGNNNLQPPRWIPWKKYQEPCSSWSSFCTSNTSGLNKDASAKEIGILRIWGNLATKSTCDSFSSVHQSTTKPSVSQLSWIWRGGSMTNQPCQPVIPWFAKAVICSSLDIVTKRKKVQNNITVVN